MTSFRSSTPKKVHNSSNKKTQHRIYSDDPAKAYLPPQNLLQKIYSDDPSKAHIPQDSRKIYSDTPKVEQANSLRVEKIDTRVDRKLNFGFYGSVGWGSSYTDQLDSFTNTVWISRELGNPLAAEATLNELKKISQSSKNKVIIDVETIFFDEKYSLYSDYLTRWHKYASLISPFQSAILSFYIMDEAYMNGARLGISYSDMQNRLEKITQAIKASNFRTVPLSLSYTTSTTHLPIPEGVDWVGVDCYGSWDSCDGKSIVEHNNVLKAKFKANHRLILFVDSMLRLNRPNQPTTDIQESELISRMKKYFVYAKDETKVAVVAAFIWQDVNSSEHLKGVSSLPKAKAELIKLASDYLQIPVRVEDPLLAGAPKAPVVSQERNPSSSKKSCVFEGGKLKETEPCVYGQATATHGEYGYAMVVSGGSGQVKAKCDNGSWIDVVSQCQKPATYIYSATSSTDGTPRLTDMSFNEDDKNQNNNKACYFDGGKFNENEPCIYGQGAASHGQIGLAFVVLGGTGQLKAKCDNGKWIEIVSQCTAHAVPDSTAKKGCYFPGGKISKSCSYAPVAAPHDGIASSEAVSGGRGAVVGKCDNGQWVDISEFCN